MRDRAEGLRCGERRAVGLAFGVERGEKCCFDRVEGGGYCSAEVRSSHGASEGSL